MALPESWFGVVRKLVYKMTDNRIALVFAISFAVSALFLLSGAEASPSLNTAFQDPEALRVDGDTPMLFGITYTGEDWGWPESITISFDGVENPVALECWDSGCDSGDPDGFWRIGETFEPDASALVANVGDGEISYRFTAF
ncbi:uncharacterized protein METZ01_LOCUS210116, partial [marine metagenome]